MKKKKKTEAPKMTPVLSGKELDFQESLGELYFTTENNKIKATALKLHKLLWPNTPMGWQQMIFTCSNPFDLKFKGAKK